MLPVVSPALRHSKLLSVGAYRPQRVVGNEEICERIDSTDDWIVSRSGIRTRRFAAADEDVITMATRAAHEAVVGAGIEPGQIGCVIVATSTHFSQTPAAAPIVAHRLGISAGAFDVSAGCAGFCYALGLASDQVRTGTSDYVLVIGSEQMSETIDLDDRSTAFLFGDGAGAVIVGPADQPGIGPTVWGSDGRRSDLITQTPQLWTSLRGNPDAPFPVISMQGTQVFRWAAFAMAPVARQALEAAALTADDLDAFVPHQANLRIIEALSRSIGLMEHTAISRDVETSGNTSAASVPLAMHAMLTSGEARGGDTALLLAFGAGLVYAGQVVELPESVTVQPVKDSAAPQAGSAR